MTSFQIKTTFQAKGKNLAFGLIRHVAINAQTRRRCALPEPIDLWLEASALSGEVTPV